ncbi:MAG TPA: GNAT family N-acetyltransferase [Solirubrobacterales bacterium]|nr:GNAT family N-acetyltransferase [Solirubrobacterales bacterium]
MISRFRRYAREHGFAAALAKSAGELRRKVVSEMRITVLLKDLDAINEPRRTSGLEVVALAESHLAGLSELNRSRGRSGVDRRFRDNLERGLKGFVGLRDGATVGYYWWVEGERAASHPDLAWLGDSLQIEPSDVYGSDFYILPEHREGGTANEFLYRMESAIAAAGFTRIWGYVESGNRQARWLYSSRGYQPMGDLITRKLLFFPRKTAQPHE